MPELDCYLACYDIDGDRDRAWAAKELKRHGHRVQESVFECFLTSADLDALRQRFRERLPATDDVAFFPLCKACRGKALTSAGKKTVALPAFKVV